MKPSTLILVGGAAVAGFLLWRAHSGSAPPSPKTCEQTTSSSTTAVGRILAGMRPALQCGAVSVVSNRGNVTTNPAPLLQVAPSPKTLSTIVQTAPSSTSTSSRTRTALTSYSYTGKVAL